MRQVLRAMLAILIIGPLCGGAMTAVAQAAEEKTAKQLFGAQILPDTGSAVPFGFYAKGCMSGAVALPADGPTWQAMRLSRNRRWGNPAMVALIEQFSRDAVKIGWGTGILVGDISQPRGGPMINGHASHQIGLDADIWFTPKPTKPLSVAARETLPFTSMLDKSKFLTVDPKRWTTRHQMLVMTAASYPQIERVFVNPAIKKKLCETWTGDRNLLGKVRPVYGHDEHFHIRMACPPGADGCVKQAAVPSGDDCGAGLAWWFSKKPWAPPPKADPGKKPVKPRPVMLSDLPKACAAVLAAAVRPETEAIYGASPSAFGPGAARSLSPSPPYPMPSAGPVSNDPADADTAVPMPGERPKP